MHSSPDPRSDETIGDDIASRLGLSVVRCLSQNGADGHVWLLDDGRVMKASWSEDDAAAALALMQACDDGFLHPAIPRVDDLFLHMDPRDPRNPIYVIVREDIDDLDLSTIPGQPSERDWRESLVHVNCLASDSQKPNALKHALETGQLAGRPYSEPLQELAEALVYFGEVVGVRVVDISDRNVGVLADGTITVRDWGICKSVPDWAFRAVKQLNLEPLPDMDMAMTP